MKTFIVIMFGLILAAALSAGISTKESVADTEKEQQAQQVVVHLSHFTDDLHRCFMSLKMANLMQEFDADVTLFLDLEGVRLAERRQRLDVTWGSNPTQLGELYDEFIEGGGRVVLCPHCAKSARIGDMALKRNAEIGNVTNIGKLLTEADKIMDY